MPGHRAGGGARGGGSLTNDEIAELEERLFPGDDSPALPPTREEVRALFDEIRESWKERDAALARVQELEHTLITRCRAKCPDRRRGAHEPNCLAYELGLAPEKGA